ncbi:MAG: hypothetical protein HZA89_14945 [Verrucomicrobia bacterium]|nr:hypothetical protein [Verrucomicrobiota bacterium]
MKPRGIMTACRLLSKASMPWLLALWCSFPECLSAQTPRWRWSNPAPHGANVQGMAYEMGLTVQIGERGQIYTSEDLAFWEPRASGTTNALRAATFLGSRLLVTGENGTVLYADSLEDFQLVSLGTGNWLEGVAASGTLAVAVGDNAAVYSSSDGAAWTAEAIPGVTNWLRSVAYGGNNFVAVGEGGLIATRGNNPTWTVQANGQPFHFNQVRYIGSQFFAVADNGTCWAGSVNLRTWTPVSPAPGATNPLHALAGTNDSLLVAGQNEVRLQENGGAWMNQITATTNFPAPAWTYYSASYQGSLYFLAGRSGMMVEGFKTNAGPTLWVTRTDPIRQWLWDVARTENFYAAAGDYGTILTSEDGVNWNLELVPDAVTNRVFLGIGGSSNGLVAAGNKGALVFSPNLITNIVSTNLAGTNWIVVTNPVSTVGVVWNAVTAPTTNDLHGVARQGGQWIVCGAGGTILTSADGTNWAAQTAPTGAYLSSVAAFPGGWVATGDRGVALTSTNGTNWITQTTGTTNWLYRVRWLNGRLVAVGENGTILTGTNGADWAAQASGSARWLNAVEHVGGNYYAAGNQGTVLISSNAAQWNSIGTLTQKSLYGAASDGSQLVLAGLEGAVLRAQIVPRQTPVNFQRFSRAAGQNLISFAGKTDQRFTLQRGTNLVDWSNGVTLELLDRSGTLLFLEAADTNAPPVEFFRALLAP